MTGSAAAYRPCIERRNKMPDNMIGFAAVVLALGFPIAAVWAWTWQRGRKFRSDERMAAIARGVTIPFEADLPPSSMSRRSGILLVAAAIGYSLTFGAARALGTGRGGSGSPRNHSLCDWRGILRRRVPGASRSARLESRIPCRAHAGERLTRAGQITACASDRLPRCRLRRNRSAARRRN